MGIRLIIAAYFALITMMFVAGVVALSIHDIKESGVTALDNSSLAVR
jgi:hypothetical protein